MIKYFNELDNRDKYYLPLIDESTKNEYNFYNYNLSISFYHKHKNLFKYAKEILKDFDLIKDELIFNKMKLGVISYEDAGSLCQEIESIKENWYSIDKFNNINISGRDCYYFLKSINRILFVLKELFEDKKEYYQHLKLKFDKVIIELDNYNSIICKRSKTQNISLPDAWFITPFNDLYNTMGHLAIKRQI